MAEAEQSCPNMNMTRTEVVSANSHCFKYKQGRGSPPKVPEVNIPEEDESDKIAATLMGRLYHESPRPIPPRIPEGVSSTNNRNAISSPILKSNLRRRSASASTSVQPACMAAKTAQKTW
jgi:hypothetical protein